MKKALIVLLAVAMLAGCEAGPAAQIAKNAKIEASILAASTVAATLAPPSPLSTPDITDSSAPADTTDDPDETESPVYPQALEAPEPGPGFPVGDIVVADKDYFYYYDYLPYKSNGPLRIAIYKKNIITGKVSKIDTISKGSFTLQQIFLDGNGNLYYVLENENSGLELYQYQKSRDKLICTAELNINRVDSRYIYMGNVWYSFKDKKKYSGNTIITEENSFSVDSSVNNTRTDFTITDNANHVSQTCSINQPVDTDYIVCTSVQDGKLILLAADLSGNGTDSDIFVVDISGNQLLDKKHIEYSAQCGLATKGMLYFEVSTSSDDINFGRKVYSYNIKTGKLTLLKNLSNQTIMDAGTSLVISGGYLWAYLKGGSDLDWCEDPEIVTKVN